MTDNTQELDEILERTVTDASSSDWQSTDYDGIKAEAKQALLDWHNKQVEEVLDRLGLQAEQRQIVVGQTKTMPPAPIIQDWKAVSLSGIEAERNKLKEES
jgi:hypothetical protein